MRVQRLFMGQPSRALYMLLGAIGVGILAVIPDRTIVLSLLLGLATFIIVLWSMHQGLGHIVLGSTVLATGILAPRILLTDLLSLSPAAVILAVWYFIYLLQSKMRRFPWSRWFLLILAGYAICVTLFSGTYGEGNIGLANFAAVIQWVLFLLSVFLWDRVFSQKNATLLLLQRILPGIILLTWAGAVISFLVGPIYLGISRVGWWHFQEGDIFVRRAVGTMENPNILGGVLAALFLLVLLGSVNSPLTVINLMGLGVALLLTGSRSAFYSLILTLFLLSPMTAGFQRKRLVGLSMLGALVLIVLWQTGSDVDVYRNLERLVLVNPIAERGSGTLNLLSAVVEDRGAIWQSKLSQWQGFSGIVQILGLGFRGSWVAGPYGFQTPHNFYINILLDLGLVGTALWGAYLGTYVFKGLTRSSKSAPCRLAALSVIICLSIQSLTESFLYHIAYVTLFTLSCAILDSKLPREKVGS